MPLELSERSLEVYSRYPRHITDWVENRGGLRGPTNLVTETTRASLDADSLLFEIKRRRFYEKQNYLASKIDGIDGYSPEFTEELIQAEIESRRLLQKRLFKTTGKGFPGNIKIIPSPGQEFPSADTQVTAVQER